MITLDQKINLKALLKIDENKANQIIANKDHDTIFIILENEFYDIDRYIIQRYTREKNINEIFKIFSEYSLSIIRNDKIPKIKQKVEYYNDEIHFLNYSISGAYSCYDY